ncbi:hypothetical protein RKE30_37985 [Streptomyces sp. Li-HN-5-11]|uniref:hypothetical protein n=1 Tax=Streptomyces sp. Li-HN-5-11 TaxID=3075432 RepID=UPI0028B23CBD|nr:hypothetical protein [Streptomyces sp. Li-HN-5-11]WNM35744.1 hypothetical protein RKE30_37985 [Streptomyces sp. Li-HN-5-11]
MKDAALRLATVTLTAGLIIAAPGSAIAAGGGGATSNSVPPPPPINAGNGGGTGASGGAVVNSAVPGVFGTGDSPQQPPTSMEEGFQLWQGMDWPNWRAIGNREWFPAGSFVDPRTRHRVHELVFTGGRYYDRDNRLRDFLNRGLGASSSRPYPGTFQEYNTTVYTRQVASSIPRRDANRIVRAVGTGDTWWTTDHYSTFHYMGQFPRRH